MLLIRVCQWIKLRIRLITKDPVEVIRAGFRKSDKPSSKIPGMFKGQLYQLPFKLIRSANRPPMLPSSTLRNLVEHRGVEPLTSTMRMSRATNCANAPCMGPGKPRGIFLDFNVRRYGTLGLSAASGSIAQRRKKGKLFLLIHR